MAGSIEYLSTPHGQTLHIPCTYGDHIVDVRVANRQHPDAVVKRMLNMGWTIGSKPKCPDCNRRISLKRKVAGAKRWEGVPTEERRAQMAALQVKSVEKRVKKDETIMPNEAEKVGDLVLSGSNVAAATPAMSAAAKKSHRLVMQALEDYYDEAKSTYREGWTDKKVASEIGVSEASVASVREEFFGPLGEPSELTAIRDALVHAEGETRKIRQRLVEHE